MNKDEMSNTKIFCVYNYNTKIFKNEVIQPIQSGCAFSDFDLGVLKDNTGKNISKKNKNYAELTDWYWVWKNYVPGFKGKNIGFCHYRRFFDFISASQEHSIEFSPASFNLKTFEKYFEKINNPEIVDKLMEQYDIIVPNPMCFENTTYQQFAGCHPKADLDKCIELIKKDYPKYTKYTDKFFNSKQGYYTLNFVMKKELFVDWCEFIFDILFKLEKKCSWYENKEYRSIRMPAYIAERIFNVWLLYQIKENNIKVKEIASLFVPYEKFTVAMPVYNGMPYIKEAVESVLRQDYKYWQLYILESCSTDKTAEYLKTLNDERIHILYSDKNLTIEENWKRILDIPTDEYLCIIGQDDTYNQDYLSTMSNLIRKHPSCNIYRTNINLMDKDSNISLKSNIKEKITIYDYLKGRLSFTYTETFHGYCIRASKYKEIGGIDCVHKLMHTDDKIVMECIGTKGYMAVAKEHAANYRCHRASVSGTPDTKAAIDGYNYWLEWIYNLNDKNLRKIVNTYLPYHVNCVKRFFTEDELKKHKEIYTLYKINEKNLKYKFIRIMINRKINYKKILKKRFLIEIDKRFGGEEVSFCIFNRSITISFKKPHVLLICRFDGIGDYILMRSFLKNIRHSKKYQNYKIIFAGRSEFAEFAEKYDREYVDEFIWVDYSKYMSSPKERLKYLEMFSKLKVTDVISPVYDRDAYFVEPILNAVKAEHIYGIKGPTTRLADVLKQPDIEKTEKKYTKLIDTSDDILFEKERYRQFFEEVSGEKIPEEDDFINIPLDIKSEYVLIAPFSGSPLRTWDWRNFVKIINYIVKNIGCQVGILGSYQEIAKAEAIINEVENSVNVYNLAGKISLAELPMYLKACKFLVSNETGTIHIAKLTGTKTVCISNGSFMGRFQPYKNRNDIIYIYPDNIEEYLRENDEFGKVSNCDVNTITPEKVIQILEKDICK